MTLNPRAEKVINTLKYSLIIVKVTRTADTPKQNVVMITRLPSAKDSVQFIGVLC